eukprot:scaffold112928_cov20-Prasinocladus_malaysianus.AAC.1
MGATLRMSRNYAHLTPGVQKPHTAVTVERTPLHNLSRYLLFQKTVCRPKFADTLDSWGV